MTIKTVGDLKVAKLLLAINKKTMSIDDQDNKILNIWKNSKGFKKKLKVLDILEKDIRLFELKNGEHHFTFDLNKQ